MQQLNVDCQRDEYPPIGFWQDQDIHSQWVRMVPRSQNGPAGAALFGLQFCRYDGQGNPPASTRNARFDRLVHGPNRDTSIFIADVTTTLSTMSIRFDNYPHDPDFGLTVNPCWPSTLVDDPGFALLNSDEWYLDYPQRQRTAIISYPQPPPLALTQNNPPRPGYQKRFIEQLDKVLAFSERNTTQELLEEYLTKLGIDNCLSEDCVDELRGIRDSPRNFGSPKISSLPKPCEAEPTAVDTFPSSTTITTAPKAGSGMQSALESVPKPTQGIQYF